jgi:glycosyltransferase involved in cell wall biosynthesis
MPAGAIWIDITELFDRFAAAAHPTGVSRVVLNLAEQLGQDPGDVFAAARPMFWRPGARAPITFGLAGLGPLTDLFPSLRGRYDAAGLPRPGYASRPMKAIATSLPRKLRYRLFPADNGVALFALWARRNGLELTPVEFAPGDALFLPGSFWLGHYRSRLLGLAAAANIPITAFVHDVLLLSHPEWLPGRHAEQFRRACEAVLPQCAAIAGNSQQTLQELRRLVRLPPDLPMLACRLADTPTVAPTGDVPAQIADIVQRRYVLYVSTLIPRKNHALLVQSWRQLWRRFGESTPYLLFVGGGASSAELAAEMALEAAEGGRIVRLTDVDDAGLEALYRQAWMTVYPSLGEGYGMPVAEALSRAKVCLASDRGAIGEAGAGLIDVIDPADPASIAARVGEYLENPGHLAAREAEIRARYRPTGWSQTAYAVRSVIEATIKRG